MSGTHTTVMGDRGRLVVPQSLRETAGWEQGTVLVMLESPFGVVLLTQDQLHERLSRDLEGTDLVSELLESRRAAARREDADS